MCRDRPDTIRCIVSSLVDDEEGGEMEDAEGDIQPLQVTDELEEDYSDPNWQPAPIDAAPGFVLCHPFTNVGGFSLTRFSFLLYGG